MAATSAILGEYPEMGELAHVVVASRTSPPLCAALAGVRRVGFAAMALTLALTTDADAAGPLAVHMAGHIILMNMLAPLAAIIMLALFPRALRRSLSSGGMLASATVVQIVALWAAHAPIFLAGSGIAWHALSLTVLFSIALLFWLTVFLQTSQHFWSALFALLVTGKLFCLLGVLLVFAPRSLYLLQSGHEAHFGPITIEDQQLAGLLMLLACPLSYLLAGVVIASRAIFALEAASSFAPSTTSVRRR
jgi:putative membrane protein